MIWETVQKWGWCREAMLEALAEAKGTHTEDGILAMICGGKLKLWQNGSSGIVTEIVNYEQIKALNFFLIGGDLLKDLVPLIPVINEYRRQQGCSRVQGLATPGKNGEDRTQGWLKLFDGAKVGGTFIYKDF